jgi:hypothetical protein
MRPSPDPDHVFELQMNLESISKIGFWFKIPSAEFKTGGILLYVEDFKGGINKEIYPPLAG